MLKDSESPPRWDVFLSHNAADKARVRRLAKALRARGLTVWFDEDTVPAGQSITLAVEEGIKQSRTMILCLSPAFLDHEWPQAERAAAQFGDPANRSRSVLPVLFSRCALPMLLAHLKYVSYLRHTEASLEEIVRAVPTSETRPPPPPSEVTRLLDAAKDAERQSNLSEAVRLATEALDITERTDLTECDSTVDACRAKMNLGSYLLRIGDNPEHSWELANAAADPALLEAYPDLLFAALTAKAEAAIWTSRFAIAEGATDAAAALQDDESDRRLVEQLRGSLALHTARPADAIRHYENAKRSFSACLNTEPNASGHRTAQRGLAACLTNLGIAHRQAGRLVDAQVALAEAAEGYQHLGATIDESAARRLIAACYFDDRDWQPGLIQLARAEELAREAHNDATLLDALELRARVAATLDNNEGARDAFVEAIEVAGNQPAARRRRLYQMTATVYGKLGDLAAASRALDTAQVLAGDDQAAVLDIEHQRRELAIGQAQSRNERAPEEIVEVLSQRISTEHVDAERANLMRRLGNAVLSRNELNKAAEWFQRSLDTATTANASHLAVDARLGLAQVAIRRDQDDLAAHHLSDALAIAEHLPHWAGRASIMTLQALLCARRGDLRAALQMLDSAHTIAFDYNLHEEKDWIDRQRDDINQWLSLDSLPAIDLSDLALEVQQLEDWFPEEQRELRRLWWYWRGDDVMQNIKTGSYVGALVVTDDVDELMEIDRSLGPLFDLTTFSTESSFTDSEAVSGVVPIPGDSRFPFINYVVYETERTDRAAPPQ